MPWIYRLHTYRLIARYPKVLDTLALFILVRPMNRAVLEAAAKHASQPSPALLAKSYFLHGLFINDSLHETTGMTGCGNCHKKDDNLMSKRNENDMAGKANLKKRIKEDRF